MTMIAHDHRKVRQAIEIVKRHLADEWITDGCENDQVFGCGSCAAVRLRSDLDALIHALDEDDGVLAALNEVG